MALGRKLLIAAVLVFFLGPALAQDRTVDVRFPPGGTGTTISDTVSGRDTVLFEVGAEAGQVMDVQLPPTNTATYFNLYAPSRGLGGETLVIGEFTEPINDWSGPLPAAGDIPWSSFSIAVPRGGENGRNSRSISRFGARQGTVSRPTTPTGSPEGRTSSRWRCLAVGP